MLWASIILPMTPPLLLLAQARMGLIPSCSALIRCRFPKRTFEEVSLPVSATPSQPSSGEKNGNTGPAVAKASPMVAARPAERVGDPTASLPGVGSRDHLPR